jgi:hypothetical protein
MSRPALNGLSLPVGSSAIQNNELTSPLTSLVVTALSRYLLEEVSRSIEKDLIEAELLNAETRQTLPDAPIQTDVPEELDSMLPLMPSLPSLDLNTQSEDKKKEYISPATAYHSSGFTIHKVTTMIHSWMTRKKTKT